MRNFNNVAVPKFDVSHLRQPLQLVAQTLGSAVVGDEKLQAKILPILAIQNEEECAENARSFDCVVIEALLFFVHEGQQSKVRAQEVAEKVSLIYEGRGFQRTVSAESVGSTIKRLRIPSGRIDRAGNGVELTADVCRQVQRLRPHIVCRRFSRAFTRPAAFARSFKWLTVLNAINDRRLRLFKRRRCGGSEGFST